MEALRHEQFDPEEMRRYGYDSSLEEDKEAWARTTPLFGVAGIADYSSDAFAFGSQLEQEDIETGQQRPDTVE